LAEVKKNNNDKNCWTIVDENVYNLTSWINSHPGGSNAILSLCGVDGTSAFKAQHTGRAGPIGQLDSYKIGKLKD
jgi:cytochrome b involved in lipid metabolism